MKRYVLVSLILHTALISVLFVKFSASGQYPPKANGKDGSQGHGDNNKEIVAKAISVEVYTPKVIQGDIPLKKKPPTKKKLEGLVECKEGQWFGGIGISQNYFTRYVDIVYPGYPAEKAGMRVGDVIVYVNSPNEEIRGEPGSEVKVTVDRKGQIIVLTMIRERICTNG